MVKSSRDDIKKKSTDHTSDDQNDKGDLNPKKRGLGRGLEALFENEEGVYPQPDKEGQTPGIHRKIVGVDQLEPGPFQPRQYIDTEVLEELAESISTHGILQPLLVRPKEAFPDTYQIIAGERRWRAAQKAQIHEVPVVIKHLSDVQALEVALIENLQREDLNPLEEAQGYKRLMDEFGHTQEKLASSLGKSRSHIANMVRLMNLPPAVQVFVRQGKLSAGHARALITANDPTELAKTIINQELSVREAEKLVSESSDSPKRKPKKKQKQKDPNTLALEEEVSGVLGMVVSIDVKGSKGSLKVNFSTLDQLDEVLHRLSHNPGRVHSDEL